MLHPCAASGCVWPAGAASFLLSCSLGSTDRECGQKTALSEPTCPLKPHTAVQPLPFIHSFVHSALFYCIQGPEPVLIKERNGRQSSSIAARGSQPKATPAPALPLLGTLIGTLWGAFQGAGKNRSQTHRPSSACHEGCSAPKVERGLTSGSHRRGPSLTPPQSRAHSDPSGLKSEAWILQTTCSRSHRQLVAEPTAKPHVLPLSLASPRCTAPGACCW